MTGRRGVQRSASVHGHLVGGQGGVPPGEPVAVARLGAGLDLLECLLKPPYPVLDRPAPLEPRFPSHRFVLAGEGAPQSFDFKFPW